MAQTYRTRKKDRLCQHRLPALYCSFLFVFFKEQIESTCEWVREGFLDKLSVDGEVSWWAEAWQAWGWREFQAGSGTSPDPKAGGSRRVRRMRPVWTDAGVQMEEWGGPLDPLGGGLAWASRGCPPACSAGNPCKRVASCLWCRLLPTGRLEQWRA